MKLIQFQTWKKHKKNFHHKKQEKFIFAGKKIITTKNVEFFVLSIYILIKLKDCIMKPLKIYLGDLTYNTVTLATEAFPLNVGLIASYCIKRFGSAVDITLFKYIDDLDSALRKSPPTILGLSNYCWSHNVSLEMFRMLAKINPDALTVWGGPNFPVDLPSQEKFIKKYPDVDIYVPVDGEVGFSNIIERALQIKSEKNLKKKF